MTPTPTTSRGRTVVVCGATGYLGRHVVRPTGFFDDLDAFRKMAARGRVWLIGDDETRINPIHGADLATVVREAVASDVTTDRSVGGPDVITQADIASLAFEAAGRSPRVMQVPSRLVGAIGRLMGRSTPTPAPTSGCSP